MYWVACPLLQTNHRTSMNKQKNSLQSELTLDLKEDDFDVIKPISKKPTLKIHNSWKDEIANSFTTNNWEVRSLYKFNPRPRKIDIFASDDSNWLAVVIRSNKFKLSRRSLNHAFLQTKFEKYNYKVLIYSGPVSDIDYHIARKLNVLILSKGQIGEIREKLLGFKREYPESHT